ncbi:MAG: hypothetical protein M0P71_12940 [Melioribacteraceae bacterium]|jgi:hypothetical protein|nr:hypothetical protein [Melioribacteraceae bacterium]
MSSLNKNKSGKEKYKLSDVYEDDFKNKDKGSGGNRANYLDLSDYPDLEFYKVKKDKNKIGILQYRITTDNHPKGREKGKTDYKLAVFVHRFFGESEGNYLCMKETFNQPCPGCKEIKKMVDSKEYTYKDKEVKDMRAQQREVFIIQDLMKNDDKFYLLDLSHWEFLKEVLAEAERDTDGEGVIPFADPDEGKAIIFYGEEREGEFKNTTYKPTGFRFKDREPVDPEIFDEVPSLDALLVIPDYEEMEKDLYGISSKEETDDDDDEPVKKKSKKPVDDDEEESEEDKDSEDEDNDSDDDDLDKGFKKAVSKDDDDDDEEEPVKKKSRKPVDEDDDEDEKPKQSSVKKKSRKPADDDDDDEPPSKKKGKQKCPSGHKFGEDCDEYQKDCSKCKLWDDCSEAYGKD